MATRGSEGLRDCGFQIANLVKAHSSFQLLLRSLNSLVILPLFCWLLGPGVGEFSCQFSHAALSQLLVLQVTVEVMVEKGPSHHSWFGAYLTGPDEVTGVQIREVPGHGYLFVTALRTRRCLSVVNVSR